MEVSTPLGEFPGVGEARAKALEKLGLRTAGDLVGYFPRSYEDRRQVYTIGEAPVGELCCVRVMAAEEPRRMHIRKGLDVTRLKVVDGASAMLVTFFNQGYVRQALHRGEEYILYGRVELLGNHRQMTNPQFEGAERPWACGRIMPVYPLTAGITNHLLAGLVEKALQGLPPPAETLPHGLRERHRLAPAADCWRSIHFPADEAELDAARRRFAFEELFYLTLGLALLRERRSQGRGPAFGERDLEAFYALLPFTLTGAQRRALEESAADLALSRPMNRLVQGDVGSGKTAVAAGCAWLAVRSGWQCAMMAPTEILAEQHCKTLAAMLAPAGIPVGRLTGSMKAAEKRKVLAALASGELPFVVGTHALLSQGVAFRRLGLVITDEQHRFGVEQRSALAAKAGGETDFSPNVLVMSATPIPRTLALIIYGDLDVSVIDELPHGRVPVKTVLVGESKRQRMYGFVRDQVQEGRQVYIVCPAVEENPEGAWDLKAVTEYARVLGEEVFPDLRVGLVHGRMKAKEKEAAMAAFTAGETHILVSTTVIEVGVDVPNASLIIIENADRYGLSQLHQLRGRVGRGQHQSWCVLVSDNRSPDTRARLKVLTQTNDGFRIAEEDLKLRGPGDFFGARQHGLPALRVADLETDTRVLKEAQEAAAEVLSTDPDLTAPEHRPLLERVRRLFEEDPDRFN
ncbi:MAG TPA: ATP-dependent DNA helicase RecG [Candidatus Intestinimonas merdavium]|uniref:ATP-dependent DNA helicase RecG n=1 Tax=Candidatus Intestinimonas merdavium TaxID=2838622 RepID=A0A9D1Z6G0_9FIRM|nr:ATP-dependent DNA helicase RecG [Candidatus Intestinimonas merdavium]